MYIISDLMWSRAINSGDVDVSNFVIVNEATPCFDHCQVCLCACVCVCVCVSGVSNVCVCVSGVSNVLVNTLREHT
jgi:hypothetical protein